MWPHSVHFLPLFLCQVDSRWRQVWTRVDQGGGRWTQLSGANRGSTIPHLTHDPKRHLRFAWLGSRPIFLELFIFRYFIKCLANLSNEFFVANFRMFQNSFLFFAFLLLPCAFASSPIRFSIIVTIITDTHTEFPKTF